MSSSVRSWGPAGLFRLLGLHPGPDLTLPAAASLAGMPVPAARRALSQLAEAHLITEHVPGRFSLHDLLRAYAAEQARSSGDDALPRAAIGRLLGYYVRSGRSAAMVLNPVREPPTNLRVPPRAPGVSPSARMADGAAARAWYEAELQTLLAAAQQALQAGFDTEAWLLSWSLAEFLDRRGSWPEWVRTQTVALTAARRLGDGALEARTERGLSRAYTEAGALPEALAHLEHVLDLDRALADSAGQADTHLAIARVLEYQAAYDQAIDHAQQAFRLLEAVGDQTGQARALNGIGWFHAQLGHHREALSCCEQALDLYRLTKDRRGEATTADSIGLAYHLMGRHAEAIAAYQVCLPIHRDLGDLPNLAETLGRLGDCYRAAGDDDQARAAWEQALAILDGEPRLSGAGGRASRLDTAPIRAKLQQLEGGGPPPARGARRAT